MAELKTFLFTDICGSVDLKGEMAGRSVTERDLAYIQTILTPHRQRILEELEHYGGRVVSTAGDGHFLVFDNTIQAALWAVDVQREHRDNPITTPGDGSVEVRISVHVGVPQIDPADPNNFVGKSVDYASRLNDFANGGQILVSRSVMAILDDIGLEGIAFHLHGRRLLKGIGRVEVHELLYDDQKSKPLRQQPTSQSDRQWVTVIPSEGEQHERSHVAVMPDARLKQVGNYELVELLGSGGMGDVYKGRHAQFDRVRAIKVIKPQLVAGGNQDMINRFYREIKAIGALEHKNIVVAIDSSAPNDDLHYLVMEYLEGISLHDLVAARGHLSVPDACEVIRQAARGLQYIHRHGMVHRDIKPSNLMLTVIDSDGVPTDSSDEVEEDGLVPVVKILDLGLALLSDKEHDRLTRFDNRAMGTGMYMSPEQWKTTSVDIRADIYSLGCTLYHLLAGNPPFFESDLRPEKAHEKSRVPPIRGDLGVPRALGEVIRKMLAKRPEDRYDNPAEVAAALTPFTEGHHLVALFREYDDPEKTPASPRVPTRVESSSRMETLLSRATRIAPSRRWLLGTGLPLLLIALLIAFLVHQNIQDRNRRIEEALARDMNNLPLLARDLAEDNVGQELTRRFAILQEAAADQQMIQHVLNHDLEAARARLDSPLEEIAQAPLLEWIKAQRLNKIDTAPSDSWFINNRDGVQIARHPITEENSNELVSSYLDNYAYRDYFHGEGKDKPQSEQDVEPITEPNLSTVYKSSTSGKLKVALSVPIRHKPTEAEAPLVIGILSMSFDLGEIEITGMEHFQDKQIVLVDLREDYVEKANSGERIATRGLILNHEHLSLWKVDDPPRIDPQVLADMDHPEKNTSTFYRDPLSIDPATRYWGAFAPVEYRVTDPITGRTTTKPSGWRVLVQSQAMN